jgi:hypothetical protein
MRRLEKSVCASRRKAVNFRRTALRAGPDAHRPGAGECCGYEKWQPLRRVRERYWPDCGGMPLRLRRLTRCGPGRLGNGPGDEVAMAPECGDAPVRKSLLTLHRITQGEALRVPGGLRAPRDTRETSTAYNTPPSGTHCSSSLEAFVPEIVSLTFPVPQRK